MKYDGLVTGKTSKLLDSLAASVTPKRSKYNAKRVKADGYTFDSQAEYGRYRELRMAEVSGAISALTVHPRFLIREAFQSGWFVVPAEVYEGDFGYFDRHDMQAFAPIVEDVKGYQTREFKRKWQLVQAKYPEIEFRIVESKQ